MKDSWPLRTIADCASQEPYATQIGPFGKALTPDEYTPSGVPLLRGVNVNQGRFHDDDFVFISEETADRMWKYESFPGDVLFVHKGTLGKIGLMPKSRRFNRYIMGNSMLRVRCDHSKLLPEYLYYWLCSADGQHYILSRVSQVGVPQIQRPLATLREAKLPIPPVGYQKAVVDVLGTLDDKIELNRRMNETLEAMARAIFKSWFVDFDPVRAKSEGRQPQGIPAHIADLFPSTFQDSPLGPIPEGWHVETLGDIATNPRDGVSPTETTPGTPYIGLEHMPRRSIALDSWGDAEDVSSGKFRFVKGSILFGKLRPYFHKIGVAPVDGVCSTDILVLEPAHADWNGFVLGHVSSREFVAYTDAGSRGTKMPRTNWNDMAAYRLAVPPQKLAAAFTHETAAFVELVVNNIHESRTLADLRDTLLPRLLSGDIRTLERDDG